MMVHKWVHSILHLFQNNEHVQKDNYFIYILDCDCKMKVDVK